MKCLYKMNIINIMLNSMVRNERLKMKWFVVIYEIVKHSILQKCYLAYFKSGMRYLKHLKLSVIIYFLMSLLIYYVVFYYYTCLKYNIIRLKEIQKNNGWAWNVNHQGNNEFQLLMS